MQGYDEREELAMRVAYLIAGGHTQEEVVNLLPDVNHQSEVSRLLDMAKKKDWIKRLWRLNLPEAHRERVEKSVYPHLDLLKKKLTRFARANGGVDPTSVHVVTRTTSHSPTTAPPSVAELPPSAPAPHDAFGQSAAPIVEKLLANGTVRTCAVAWGNTIKGLLDAITRQPRPNKALTFVPISGEPLNVPNLDFSPTRAAGRLAELFQVAASDTCSLRGIAARIPKSLDKNADIIKDFLSSSDDYKRVFGGSDPLCAKLDMIITGIGDVITSRKDPWFEETMELEGRKDLADIAAGNIGGIWIPNASATAKQKEIVRGLNDRWLGVREVDFRSCSDRARDGEHPGVVVLAIENSKAGIVERAMGLINHIILDRELADAILGPQSAEKSQG